MIYTKYKFTPFDLANYILLKDLSHNRTNEVIEDLFENYNNLIVYPFRNDFMKLKRAISWQINLWELDDNEYNEAKFIMSEISNSDEFNEFEANYFDAYFKLIKLQLMYSVNFKKIRLRNLLKDFGYKRRTTELMKSMNRTLNALGLETYLKNYELCNICDIALDDMIIIRLKY